VHNKYKQYTILLGFMLEEILFEHISLAIGRMQGPQHTRQPEPISKPPISIYQFSGLDHSRACQHMKVTWWQNATLQSTTPVYYPLVTLVTKLSIPFKSHYCNINNSPRDTY
ncbi:hypothetical protein SUGI_0245400, partial [Cryptomeria japonica]